MLPNLWFLMDTAVINKTSISTVRLIALLCNYFLGYWHFYNIGASNITLMLDPHATQTLPSVQLGTYAWTAGITIWIVWLLLKYSWIKFVCRLLKNIIWTICLFLILYAGSSLLGWIIEILTDTTSSVNEQFLIQTFKTSPSIFTIILVFLVPITEEAIFRVGLYSWLRMRMKFWLAASISGIVFGSIHIAHSLLVGNFTDAIYIIVYAFLGVGLAYAYEKTSSCIPSMLIHIMNNFVDLH